jgi:hypothetical protein
MSLGGDERLLGRGLGPGGESLRRRAPADGPMGPDGVVVGPEAVELGLELGQGGRLGLAGQVLSEGLVEALDLAAGLGLTG